MASRSRFGFSWGGTASGTAAVDRKSEVNDLRMKLRDPYVERDNLQRRDVLKKIIALMTLGVDTSSVFTEMVMASVSKDLVQKKMVYFYLAVQSEHHADLAVLTINTLQKDCRDESPLVRGLALRSLASLRLAQLAEYLAPILRQSLVDTSPYVRKTAIVATAKLFRIAPEAYRGLHLTEKLYGMLRDNDVNVSMNALAVLHEVTALDGGVTVNKNILYFLLNRLRDVPEWHQPQVIRLAHRYTPASEAEIFDIMNLLEERLQGSNSGVILASAHVFLALTQNLPTVHRQVFDRLREPLLTLMTTAPCVELSYAVLCHILLLVRREPSFLWGHYKDFYWRQNDPSYVKAAKMEVLAAIATDNTCRDILTELMAYVGDPEAAVSSMAIRTAGAIALSVQVASPIVLQQFLELMALDVEHIRATVLTVMRDFLRKYTSITFVRPFLDCLVKAYGETSFEDEESRVALVWTLGEFGEHIDDAPYILEGLTSTMDSLTPSVKNELLTACMKLFFARPPEMQPVLAAALAATVNDFSNADVHDRALLYYRLLRADPTAAARVVRTAKAPISTFFEDGGVDQKDKLFEEFDSFSVVYQMPSSQFQPFALAGDQEEEADDDADDADVDGDDAGDAVAEGLLESHALELSEDPTIDPPTFQRKWSRLETVDTLSFVFAGVPAAEDLDAGLEDYNILTMAKGQQGGTLKLYLYAQVEGCAAEHILVELLVQATGVGSATVKADDTATKKPFVAVLKRALQPFLAKAK